MKCIRNTQWMYLFVICKTREKHTGYFGCFPVVNKNVTYSNQNGPTALSMIAK